MSRELLDPTRLCAWCHGVIPATMRADSICCSVRCRQARHRFTTGVGVGVALDRGEPLRLAYADPPYPGKSKRYYGDHPDFAGEVDHAELIASLAADYDGWALSTSASALPYVLSLCPREARVAAWFRGDRGGRSLGPLNAWEPVIYMGGRESAGWRSADRDDGSGSAGRDASDQAAAEHDASVASTRVDLRVDPDGEADASRDAGTGRRVDALVFINRPRLTDPDRVIGAKPAAFCRWVFDLLGADPKDEFVDVFPGSGGVMRAWSVFSGE